MDDPKVMFYNAEKGEPLPGENHKISGVDLSVPVGMLFNENSSAGEVVPLESGTVDYSENGVPGKIEFKEGENMVLGMDQVSARPGALYTELLRKYEDRLAVSLDDERPVRVAGLKATEAVLAASDTVPMMQPGDMTRLERYLTYGDVISIQKACGRLTADDVKDRAMMRTGDILCRDISGLRIDGATMFKLSAAAGGSLTEGEIRAQYRNAGAILPIVPPAYEDADKFLTGDFAKFMEAATNDKEKLAKGLADQWDKLDRAADPMPDRMPGELAMMHLACYQMGWHLVPEPKDAAALGRSLKAYQDGDKNGFEQIIYDSLVKRGHGEREFRSPVKERPAEKGPDPDDTRRKPMSATERLFAMVARMKTEEDGTKSLDGPQR